MAGHLPESLGYGLYPHSKAQLGHFVFFLQDSKQGSLLPCCDKAKYICRSLQSYLFVHSVYYYIAAPLQCEAPEIHIPGFGRATAKSQICLLARGHHNAYLVFLLGQHPVKRVRKLAHWVSVYIPILIAVFWWLALLTLRLGEAYLRSIPSTPCLSAPRSTWCS